MRIPIILISLVFTIFLSLAVAENKKVCLKGVCIKAEVADSQESRTKGLMFRKSLGTEEGMLFILQGADSSIWMKNMQFPLDMIWIAQDKKIIEIKENVLPCQNENCPSFSPDKKAEYILEINGGFVNKHGIKISDSVSF